MGFVLLKDHHSVESREGDNDALQQRDSEDMGPVRNSVD